MTEFAGWIVAALVGAIAVLVKMLNKSRSAAIIAAARGESGRIVEAQRAAAVKVTNVSVEEVAELLKGDDPNGKLADRSNERRARR